MNKVIRVYPSGEKYMEVWKNIVLGIYLQLKICIYMMSWLVRFNGATNHSRIVIIAAWSAVWLLIG